MSTVQLDLADIQGDILRAYGNAYDCTSYAFVHITGEPAEAREWFAGLLDHVTTAEPWREGKPLTTLNVALTAAGLRALGVSPRRSCRRSRSSSGREWRRAPRSWATAGRARPRSGSAGSAPATRTSC